MSGKEGQGSGLSAHIECSRGDSGNILVLVTASVFVAALHASHSDAAMRPDSVWERWVDILYRGLAATPLSSPGSRALELRIGIHSYYGMSPGNPPYNPNRPGLYQTLASTLTAPPTPGKPPVVLTAPELF